MRERYIESGSDREKAIYREIRIYTIKTKRKCFELFF